ncbi:MAG: hypothetical protein GX799_09525 [Crenarchaeota archaeon]|jgi:hypothetical protein|nr:hypothetical protein [Thermoproteota archaeon]
MEAMLKQILGRESPRENFDVRNKYMLRVHEVQSPCQWLEHCNNGKCPALVRLNGNYYCAKIRPST